MRGKSPLVGERPCHTPERESHSPVSCLSFLSSQLKHEISVRSEVLIKISKCDWEGERARAAAATGAESGAIISEQLAAVVT